MLQWNSTYETGHKFIDLEHQLLFDMANQVAAHGITHPERFKELYFELIQYTNLHFHTEEIVMKEIGYQQLQTHQISHQEILKNMYGLLQAHRDMGVLLKELEAFLQKWLVNHIVREDLAWRPVYLAWKNARLGRQTA